jgi:hypothetical protein
VQANKAIEGSAEQRCCSVPSSLRSSAPPHCRRYAALTARHFSLTRMLAAFPVGIVNISGL